VLAEKMDEVGRMIGGWLKSVSGARVTACSDLRGGWRQLRFLSDRRICHH